MKQRDLIKLIEAMAAERSETVEWRQGKAHLVARIGTRRTTVPRHREVNDLTARSAIAALFGKDVSW